VQNPSYRGRSARWNSTPSPVLNTMTLGPGTPKKGEAQPLGAHLASRGDHRSTRCQTAKRRTEGALAAATAGKKSEGAVKVASRKKKTGEKERKRGLVKLVPQDSRGCEQKTACKFELRRLKRGDRPKKDRGQRTLGPKPERSFTSGGILGKTL